jgi:chromosome segregation ATPase
LKKYFGFNPNQRLNPAYFCMKHKRTNGMLKNLLFTLSAGALLISCSGEKDKLQSELDSLRSALQENQQFVETLGQVGVLMDSIDANRQLLRVNMVEGTSYDDYTARMRDINNYVKDTQNKIEDLEKSLKKSKGVANSYAATVKKLKADLETRNQEIVALQANVEQLKGENQKLITTVGLQEAELSDKEAQIIAKQQELALIEARIQELMLQSKMSEADAYYERGKAIEEAAKRTKLAPRKKKDTYREALELYKKAVSLGKAEAQAKVTELEKKLD